MYIHLSIKQRKKLHYGINLINDVIIEYLENEETIVIEPGLLSLNKRIKLASALLWELL